MNFQCKVLQRSECIWNSDFFTSNFQVKKTTKDVEESKPVASSPVSEDDGGMFPVSYNCLPCLWMEYVHVKQAVDESFD